MPRYRLVRPAPSTPEPPALDADQRAVVEHDGGPLLVLAGPGTGKTTTLVETVAHRVRERGTDAERVLVLTFGRRAAAELRTRLAVRLAGQPQQPTVTTFHAFCYGLLRQASPVDEVGGAPALLSAPEHDARITELLAGADPARTGEWPARLRPALRTHGFARELQSFFARVRTLGLDPEEVRELALAAGRPDWRVAAAFHEEVMQVLDAQDLLDHAELVHRARLLLLDPATGPALADRFDLVVVDEYQDTDPAQVSLLRGLAGGGRDLVVVGDPDQSIYAFRGADVGGLWSFPADFATAAGPAPVLALSTTRRFGTNIADATRSIVAGAGAAGPVDATTFRSFRHPRTLADDPGEVVVQTFRSAAAEADHVAAMLRRAHLEEGTPWRDMAVLVRSVTAAVPRLGRALAAAGVPVEVAGDEVPLRSEPAVGPLLHALGLAERLAAGEPMRPQDVVDLLTGPLGRLDATALRRLGRALRRVDARDADGEPTPPRPSADLLAVVLTEPLLLRLAHDAGAGVAAERAEAVVDRVRAAALQVQERRGVEDVLWRLWDGSAWSRSLRARAEAGAEGSADAHRDLDAVCALFTVAARSDARPHRSVRAFLDEVRSQQIPSDTRSEAATRRDAVRLMTAHRAKGLEWPVVVVAGVQEGTWPDLRHRGTLLSPERLGAGGPVEPPGRAALLAEERRLFYVACTRARRRLVVTAVDGLGEADERPSRFCLDLRAHATVPPRAVLGRPDRPLSLRGVVGELRALAESTEDPAVREAAASRLAVLAARPHEETAAARPERWWGLRGPTRSATPVRDPDEPVRLSGSALAGLVSCPLSWFLSREARGETSSSSAQGFGLVVHALAADLVADPTIGERELAERMDTVWHRLAFTAPWIAERERRAATDALRRLLRWHRSERGRTALAAEHSFCVTVPVGDDAVVLRGSMDRVEVDAGGRVHVVDLKTGRSKPTGAEVAAHAQLGAYQAAVEHGAVDDLLGGDARTAGGSARSGGAELVHLRLPAGARTPDDPVVQPQDGPRDEAPLAVVEQLAAAVRTVRDEDFVARPSERACRTCAFAHVCPAQPQGRGLLPVVPVGERSA